MKPSEVLKRAYRLIRKPENWTRGVSARDADGEPVLISAKEACRFCAYGAMLRVTPHKEYAALNEAEHLLRVDAQKHGHRAISDANDNSTHDAVLRAFRRAYRAAKKAEEGK